MLLITMGVGDEHPHRVPESPPTRIHASVIIAMRVRHPAPQHIP